MARGKLLKSVRQRIRLNRVRRVLFWVVGIFLVYTFFGGPFGFIHYQQLKNRQAELLLESRQLTARAADVERQIYRLQFDTLYIEKVARERYGFARPKERVFKITPH